MTTGMRPSEYLALKWTDIDWQRGTASVCRTIQMAGSEWAFDDTKRRRSRRIVKLQNFVLNSLRALKVAQQSKRDGNSFPSSELIFVSTTGLPLKQRAVKREFRKLSGDSRDTIGTSLRLASHSGDSGHRRWRIGKSHLRSVGTCEHFIHIGAILARIAIDPGRGGGEGRATFDCLDDELKLGAARKSPPSFARQRHQSRI